MKSYQIEIVQDEYPEDPRNWDNLGRMLCAHKRYNLGDTLEKAAPGWGRNWISEFYSWSEVEGAMCKRLGSVVHLPLYMYDHSGITIRTHPFSCPWDSGQIGFIYATREDILTQLGGGKRLTQDLRRKAKAILIEEVSAYDSYVRGDVYGFVVRDEEGGAVDSLWGFYDIEEARAEAIGTAEFLVKIRIREHAEQVKAWIRNGVPFEYRYPLGINLNIEERDDAQL